MNNAHRIDHLVAGKATGGNAVEPAKGIEGRVPGLELGLPIGGVAPLAPGIKAEFLLYITQMVGDHVDTAQVVMQQVMGALIDELIAIVTQGLKGTAQLTLVLPIIVCCVGAAVVNHLYCAHIVGGFYLPGCGVGIHPLVATAAGAVGKGDFVVVFGHLGDLVKGAVGQAAAVAAKSAVAVGVVLVLGSACLNHGVGPSGVFVVAVITYVALVGYVAEIIVSNRGIACAG